MNKFVNKNATEQYIELATTCWSYIIYIIYIMYILYYIEHVKFITLRLYFFYFEIAFKNINSESMYESSYSANYVKHENLL